MVFIVGLLAIIVIGLIHPLGLNEAPLGHVATPHDRSQGGHVPPRPQGLLRRVQRPDRRRGHRQRCPAVPRTPDASGPNGPRCCSALILGAMLLGLAVLAKRWQIGPRQRPDRAEPDHGDVRRAGVGLLHRVDHHHHRAGARGQHVLRRTPRAGQPGGAGQLPAPPLRHAGRPPDLRQRHRGARRPGGRAPARGGGQHEHADPSLRHRGVHRLHAVADRTRGALAEDPAARVAAPRRHQRGRARASPPSPPSSSWSRSSPRGPGWS